MSSKPKLNDAALQKAKKAIKKLQKEKMPSELIAKEMALKGIDPETTTRLITEMHSEYMWEAFTTGFSSLAFGLVMAGFGVGTWLGWIEFDFLSERRVFILIAAGLVGVVMIGIGILVLIETLFEVRKRP